MTHRMTLFTAGLTIGSGLLAAQMLLPPLGHAEEPACPPGTYWNPAVVQCLPYGVNPVVGPAGPVGVGPVGPGPVGPGPVGPGPVGPGGLGPR